MGRSYAAYLFSLLLFGSNGIVAALIALSSLDIVVARTFLGALLLGALYACAQALRKRRVATGIPLDRPSSSATPSARPSASAAAASSDRSPARATSCPSVPAATVPSPKNQHAERRAFALFVLSGAALGASWIVLFEAYRVVGVGTASLLYYCGPVIVMALAPLLFKEHVGAAKVAGFGTVALGAVLVSAHALEGGQDPYGLLLGAASAFAYAAMIVCTKKATQICPEAADQGLRNSFLQLLAGFFVSAGYLVITQGPAALILPIGAGDIAPLLMLGLVNTGIGCFLYFTSVGRLPVQTVAVCGYLEPLSAVVLSALILGEPMGFAQIAGAALIVGGALFCELSGKLHRPSNRKAARRAPAAGRKRNAAPFVHE